MVMVRVPPKEVPTQVFASVSESILYVPANKVLGAETVNEVAVSIVPGAVSGKTVTPSVHVPVNGDAPVSAHTISGAGLPAQTAPPPVGFAAVGSGFIVTTVGSETMLGQLDGAIPNV